jgi:hypothetical protein
MPLALCPPPVPVSRLILEIHQETAFATINLELDLPLPKMLKGLKQCAGK